MITPSSVSSSTVVSPIAQGRRPTRSCRARDVGMPAPKDLVRHGGEQRDPPLGGVRNPFDVVDYAALSVRTTGLRRRDSPGCRAECITRPGVPTISQYGAVDEPHASPLRHRSAGGRGNRRGARRSASLRNLQCTVSATTGAAGRLADPGQAGQRSAAGAGLSSTDQVPTTRKAQARIGDGKFVTHPDGGHEGPRARQSVGHGAASDGCGAKMIAGRAAYGVGRHTLPCSKPGAWV